MQTVRKWRDRSTEGEAGLFDRSSRPGTPTNPQPDTETCRRRIIELRQRRWGADHIAFEVGHAASTVQKILVAEGLGRLDEADLSHQEPVVRYQRERPGELVHVDVKKLAGIPDGGGWRIHGRGQAPGTERSSTGYRFLHQHSMTAPASSTQRSTTTNKPSPRSHSGSGPTTGSTTLASPSNAVLHPQRLGLQEPRLARLPDRTWDHPETHPALPAPDQRQDRTLPPDPARGSGLHPRLAHRRAERSVEYGNFIDFYNHHRAHGALGWSTPMSTLKDNVPGELLVRCLRDLNGRDG